MTLEEWAFAITVVAAVVYLLIEALDGRRWWRERRCPPPEPEVREVEEARIGTTGAGPFASRRFEARPLSETWPDERVAEAEERWDEMLRGEKPEGR